MRLIDETNKAEGTYYKVMKVANLKNLAIQYHIIAAASDTIELQLWGTVYTDTVDSDDDEWNELTEFLTEHKNQNFIITNDEIHDIVFLDSSVTLAKIKIKYIVTTNTPNNSIKVGWNTNM